LWHNSNSDLSPRDELFYKDFIIPFESFIKGMLQILMGVAFFYVSDPIRVVFPGWLHDQASINFDIRDFVLFKQLSISHSAPVLDCDTPGHPFILQNALDLGGCSQVWNVQ